MASRPRLATLSEAAERLAQIVASFPVVGPMNELADQRRALGESERT